MSESETATEPHACIECGYFTRHAYFDGEPIGEYVHVDSDYRNGDSFGGSTTAVCFARQRVFFAELSAKQRYFIPPEFRYDSDHNRRNYTRRGQNRAYTSIRQVETSIWDGIVKTPFACSEFTPWQRGFTPKEHREMVDREYLRKREDDRDRLMFQREDSRDKREFRQ